ncbi:alkaline phosphatase family protein [Frigidibacter oleivorans]|uniref:alkaline phosphatase family protein n=1 Tax=Frigidibacter oleivorans TaxID=2487129 RepID=UPI000F8EA40C|nr:alkaline phosphatase family protein [Frigidibacter oleivorans]
MTTRTLLIGLDGATYTVLDQFLKGTCEEGVVMPFLAGLMEQGYAAKLKSTNHPLTPPAWTSVMTGRTPGVHGIYDFVRFEDMGHELFFTLYDARDIRVETIWEFASRAGQSVVSLNFPMMAPPPRINGSLVPGFVSWKHLRRNVTPPELYDRIKSFDGFDPKELSWDFERESQIGDVMEDAELYRWVERHLPRDRQWFNIGIRLLKEDQPDLFALMLDGTDKIQHQAWHVLDPALWDGGKTEDAKKVRALVVSYFRELDGFLAELHAAAPQAQMIIVSDHGFTGSEKVVRVNKYLETLGVLTWRESDGSDAAKRRDMANFANLDWTRTQAFCPTPSSNGIVIRKKSDACPCGVAPEDYAAFRDKLIADLLEMRDDATGLPVIQAVLPREEAFPGGAMENAPDLTLILSDHGFVSVRNKEPAVVTRPIPLGTHHPDGIFIMAGPGVAHQSGAPMSIVDTTVIASHCLGLDIPSDLEGRIPEDLFTADWLASHPVKMGAATAAGAAAATAAPAPATPGAAEDEQREEILAQLRLLGYLED